MSPWLRNRRAISKDSRDKPDEAETAGRARIVEKLALFIWILFAWSVFGFGMYTLAVKARTRLEPFFVIQAK
jgi:hypothetical protein